MKCVLFADKKMRGGGRERERNYEISCILGKLKQIMQNVVKMQ